MKKIILIIFCLGSALMMSPDESGARVQLVAIGTGGVTGVYYPTGEAICRIINSSSEAHNLKATVEATSGSVYNIDAVVNGDLEFGLAQSDRQYQAVSGKNEWEAEPREKLRAVFSLHPEAVTLIAGDDSGIDSLAAMKGKRIGVGNPGSGQLGNSRDALMLAGLDEKGDIQAEYIQAEAAAGALQEGRIDAFFYTVGHPNDSVREATEGRIRVHIVEIADVQSLIARYPYYARTCIPMRYYPKATNLTKQVATFGVKATLVTSADIPDEIVYVLVKEVFANLEEFKRLHPAYSVLTRENMLEGLSAPLHSGAIRYYKEAGLM
ncbi:MAG: TAXI family TRAP transporter solute-binding subunit [Deltaproteobacteria bacterium]|nr:TAXI family TRAP transporter solute-binding subunit [Deltaproteobacteria bacterium]